MHLLPLPSVPLTVRWTSVGALAALIVFAGLGGGEKAGGDARLISYEPLPEMQEDSCVIPSGTLMAAPLRVTSMAAAQSTTLISNPLRVIQDPYSAFSSVAVDIVRNEVVATDENHFQILVYDRQDNTPPTAAMTEPKRVISGSRTEIEFQCGLYIDQTTGDIYAVNNDTRDKLVIFSRQAEGDVPPDRWLHTPHGTFGIAVDEENQELFLTVQHDSAVVVYNKMATEEEPPLRLLQGNRTRLADPHGIAVDTKRDLVFVANYGSTHDVSPTENEPGSKPNWPVGRGQAIPGSGKFYPAAITVYSRTAKGNTPPLRVIEGPKTGMNWPTGMAFHSERNELFVSNDMVDSILVFDGNAQGNVAPIRVLKGPNTGIDNPTGIYLDTENDELWVANFGNHSLSVYKITAQGDTPPLRTIRSALPEKPSLMIGNPGAVAYDTRRKEILVPN
ncbi:hypothetical protein MYX82_08770 [Acidobacteria bacterium AH-259-D05]|nr:hypothetical protein [Acidobacteria bacterium AH-259-D05]